MKRKNLIKKVALTSVCLSVLSSSFAMANLDNLGVSQSYFVTEQGRPFSVKSEVPAEGSGWLTLFSPDGFFYQKETVETFGSKYVVLESSRQVHTIDSQGEFYKGMLQYADAKVKVKGGNYFITKKDTLYIIKSDGELVKQEKKAPKLKVEGGIFFITKKKDSVVIVNPFTGNLDEKPALDVEEITHQGDNFFIGDNNKIYTIGFNKKDDQFESYVSSFELPTGITSIKRVGGNFFIDQDNLIHTVSDSGDINLNSNPSGTLILEQAGQTPSHVGGNYLIYPDNSFYLMNEFGVVNFVKKITDPILVTNK